MLIGDGTAVKVRLARNQLVAGFIAGTAVFADTGIIFANAIGIRLAVSIGVAGVQTGTRCSFGVAVFRHTSIVLAGVIAIGGRGNSQCLLATAGSADDITGGIDNVAFNDVGAVFDIAVS